MVNVVCDGVEDSEVIAFEVPQAASGHGVTGHPSPGVYNLPFRAATDNPMDSHPQPIHSACSHQSRSIPRKIPLLDNKGIRDRYTIL